MFYSIENEIFKMDDNGHSKVVATVNDDQLEPTWVANALNRKAATDKVSRIAREVAEVADDTVVFTDALPVQAADISPGETQTMEFDYLGEDFDPVLDDSGQDAYDQAIRDQIYMWAAAVDIDADDAADLNSTSPNGWVDLSQSQAKLARFVMGAPR